MFFEASDIRKSFGGVQALKGAEFSVSGSRICGLVGSNGSGKSTFARICAGLLQKDNGIIKINDNEVHLTSAEHAQEYGIVLAHQNLSLIPDLRVWQNISLATEARTCGIFLDDKKARSRAAEVLESLIPGEISIETRVKDLSPEHKQMVEIAKAISKNPQLLILDEPTAALQYQHVDALFGKIRELKAKGVSIIFVSHRLSEITAICDQVIAFRDGETVGTLDFENSPRDEKLIVPMVAGDDTVIGGCDDSVERISNNVNLELRHISFGSELRNINLVCKEGEILGIGGLHGQGQDELINLIAGDIKAETGEVYIKGKSEKFKHPYDAIKKGVYLVPGDRLPEGLYSGRDVFFNSVIPLFAMKLEPFFINGKRLQEKISNIMERTMLKPKRSNMLVNNLSGGNQQKVVFGKWLAMNPSVLLLNDPMKGIDIQARNTLYSIVNNLACEGTSVVLFASSNEELIANCDRVIVMFEGEIVEELSGDDINEENLIKSSLRVG